jgi:Uncharacterized conserved protein
VRASWKGYFRIGDVVMPVRLYAATRSINLRFVQLDAKTHSPVQRVTVSTSDGRELTDDEIVRAVDYEGTLVELNENEIERGSGFERDIVVRQITDATAIDPIYYSTPYYLVPDKGGELIYAVLRQAFEKTGKVAIATLLFYGRERLAMIVPREGVLHLQTLRFHEEIVPQSSLRMPALPQPAPGQVSLASRVLEHYHMPFYASDYRNRQTDLLRELIERKVRGLPPEKRTYIASNATPEDQITGKMEKMLDDDPQTLDQ